MEISANAPTINPVDETIINIFKSDLKSFECDFNMLQRKYIKTMLEYCENSKLVKVITLKLAKLEMEPENTEGHMQVLLKILGENKCNSDGYKDLLKEMNLNSDEYIQRVKCLRLRYDQLPIV